MREGNNENVWAYNCRLRELLGKLENQPVDGLKEVVYRRVDSFSMEENERGTPLFVF